MVISQKRGRPPTFDLRTRKYFAHLIELHGMRGACEAARVPVSKTTLVKVAKEFGIRLQAGRRPADRYQIPSWKLASFQQEQLTQILALGPIAAGYRTDRWTCRRIADVIQKTFELKCHPSHLEPLLRRIGFSVVGRSVIALRADKEFLVSSTGMTSRPPKAA